MVSHTAEPPMRAAPQGGKPPEIELWSNSRLIHPLSRRLTTLLIPTGISPNQVSCLGVVASASAAAAYGGLGWPVNAFVGFALHVGWHVLDGADGDLARRTGRSSPSGEVVDGVCDYLSHIILYSVLAALLVPTMGSWAWALAALSGVARAVQANSYESRRRAYQHRMQGGSWLKQTLAPAVDGSAEGRIGGPLQWLGQAYMAISDRVAGQDPRLEAVLQSRTARDPAAVDRLRSLYRDHQAGALRGSFLLSANARTVALFISMLAGSPLYFFLHETIVLSAVLVVTLAGQRRCNASLLRALGQASA